MYHQGYCKGGSCDVLSITSYYFGAPICGLSINMVWFGSNFYNKWCYTCYCMNIIIIKSHLFSKKVVFF